MDETTILDAREALRLADSDPRRAAAQAAAVLARARAAHDHAAAAVAQRALGLAAMHVEDLDVALSHLRGAIRHGRRANSPLLAAEARMTLAFVLNRRGRSRTASAEIDTAIRDLDGVPRARAEAQRGAIMHQLGRFDEALSSYQRALPVLRKAGDELWMLRVLSNRGLLHAHRQEFAVAETDLREAEQLSRSLDLGLWSAFVQQNLGQVSALRGDVPAALNYLHLAEQRLGSLRSKAGPLLVDRSELLLSVRLAAEAREAAEQAVAAFEAERRSIAVPEVRLLLARAATVEGDVATTLLQAERAEREFARQQRPQWSILARLMVLTARAATPDRHRVRVGQVERCIGPLVEAGWPAAALEARLLAARLAFDRGQIRRALDHLELAGRARRRGPATLRARGWYAQAQLRLATGNKRGATTAVRAGLRILDEHRATLGATDLRAHASGHRVELVDLGLRIALTDGRPGQIFAWAERGRASHLLLRPARPTDDPVLADLLAELRVTVAQIIAGGKAGSSVTRLVQRQVSLERRIRDHSRLQRKGIDGNPVDPVRLSELARDLGDAALLEFVIHDGTLHVLSVVGGRVRLHRIGPVDAVRELVDRVTFTLRRLGHPAASHASRSAASALLRRSATALDELVLGATAAEAGDRPLVVIPTGALQSLPWSVLPSCVGRPVTVAPSATLWHQAAAASAEPMPRRVAVGFGLPGAVIEAETVGALHRTAALVDEAATVGAVTRAMNGAGLAHIAAHGRVQPQNPLFSSLMLADGPLTVYDIERLDRMPRMVILAACDSGRTVVRAGDELLGISATLLSRGARQVIASVVPVPDVETAPMMVAFHELLLAGRQAPQALAEVQKRFTGEDTAGAAAAAGFVCVGAAATIG
ncbi:CHAT domain-containing protein [Jidongwangia harbinensis]|uniref:CHAT domain-containing protein n=1 Tax=Jidongwangia harbinensis TaxID=2878561 RepID=UPI001CD9CF57|nr:CHAT domain-containing tetratricopeptide repeat protein [Jidongwangia harbinensis]MCA2219242.1 CHAT domain-containing protein [Jidongwangia harbinensis]